MKIKCILFNGIRLNSIKLFEDENCMSMKSSKRKITRKQGERATERKSGREKEWQRDREKHIEKNDSER